MQARHSAARSFPFVYRAESVGTSGDAYKHILGDSLFAHVADNNLDHEAENNLTEHDAAQAVAGQVP